MIVGGLQEETRNDVVLVGTSNVVISPTRHTTPRRKVITVRNNSNNAADIIYISFGFRPAETGKGIILKQFESFTDSDSEGYTAYQDQINAICDTANGKLAIFER